MAQTGEPQVEAMECIARVWVIGRLRGPAETLTWPAAMPGQLSVRAATGQPKVPRATGAGTMDL